MAALGLALPDKGLDLIFKLWYDWGSDVERFSCCFVMAISFLPLFVTLPSLTLGGLLGAGSGTGSCRAPPYRCMAHSQVPWLTSVYKWIEEPDFIAHTILFMVWWKLQSYWVGLATCSVFYQVVLCSVGHLSLLCPLLLRVWLLQDQGQRFFRVNLAIMCPNIFSNDALHYIEGGMVEGQFSWLQWGEQWNSFASGEILSTRICIRICMWHIFLSVFAFVFVGEILV